MNGFLETLECRTMIIITEERNSTLKFLPGIQCLPINLTSPDSLPPNFIIKVSSFINYIIYDKYSKFRTETRVATIKEKISREKKNGDFPINLHLSLEFRAMHSFPKPCQRLPNIKRRLWDVCHNLFQAEPKLECRTKLQQY